MIASRIHLLKTGLSNLVNMARLAWQAHPAYLSVYVVLELVQGVFPLATALITKWVFDLLGKALQNDADKETLLPRLLGLLLLEGALVVLTKISSLLGNYLEAELGRKLKLQVQRQVYQKIISLEGLAYFENPRFYDTIQLAIQGAEGGPMQVVSTLLQWLKEVTTLLGFIGVLVTLNPLLPFVIFGAALPELYLNLKIGRQHLDLATANSPKWRLSGYYGLILHQVYYAKELRLFNLGNYFLKAFLRTTQELQQSERHQQLRELRYQLFLGILSSIISSGAFIVVIIQAVSGNLSLGDITFYLTALGTVQGGILSIIYSISGLNQTLLFYTNFTTLMALPQPIQISTRQLPVPPLRSGIELRNVSFRYTEEHPWVLREVNLFIPAGRCLALVGLNGAGKTTLVKLLTHLYDPIDGQILWDGIDIREFDTAALRHRISAIFQDFVHYEMTVQQNIGVGDIAQVENLARIQQAAANAGIHDAIEHLPQGYRTLLSRWLTDGNGTGVDLSGGQWQKIAIARMFMRDADLLILDEPTSALDAKAEYEIYQHFVQLMAARTTLLISHRFSTVRMADCIAVLEDGQIAEYGSHDELITQQGTYARLYQMQAARYYSPKTQETMDQ